MHGSPKDELPVKATDVETVASPIPSGEPASLEYYTKLIFCILGLQVSYVTWGLLQVRELSCISCVRTIAVCYLYYLVFFQERIMTESYDGEQFTNSQFLVFVNRILAWCVAGIYIFSTRQPRHIGPFYEYSYASISNTLSSWCQYEALKFVSFPTQVLAKSFKVVPVMLMGKVVSNRTYPANEYFTAVLLSVGVSMFLLSKDDSSHPTTATTFAGVIILGGYMLFDSFTSNWQSELFKKYKMSSMQMMFGVNTFSCLFTVGSLLFRGQFFPNIGFIFRHFDFAVHAVILSICSAVGQLFIFYTIATFGPLVFTLIMTTRQAISIITSCLIYGHVLSVQALIGVGIVFLSLFLRTYFKTLEKKGGLK